jgi:hypothetical protein
MSEECPKNRHWKIQNRNYRWQCATIVVQFDHTQPVLLWLTPSILFWIPILSSGNMSISMLCFYYEDKNHNFLLISVWYCVIWVSMEMLLHVLTWLFFCICKNFLVNLPSIMYHSDVLFTQVLYISHPSDFIVMSFSHCLLLLYNKYGLFYYHFKIRKLNFKFSFILILITRLI